MITIRYFPFEVKSSVDNINNNNQQQQQQPQQQDDYDSILRHQYWR